MSMVQPDLHARTLRDAVTHRVRAAAQSESRGRLENSERFSAVEPTPGARSRPQRRADGAAWAACARPQDDRGFPEEERSGAPRCLSPSNSCSSSSWKIAMLGFPGGGGRAIHERDRRLVADRAVQPVSLEALRRASLRPERHRRSRTAHSNTISAGRDTRLPVSRPPGKAATRPRESHGRPGRST